MTMTALGRRPGLRWGACWALALVALGATSGCSGCNPGDGFTTASPEWSLAPSTLNLSMYAGGEERLTLTLRNDGSLGGEVLRTDVVNLAGPIDIDVDVTDDPVLPDGDLPVVLTVRADEGDPGLGRAQVVLTMNDDEELFVDLVVQVLAAQDCDDGNPCTFNRFDPDTGVCIVEEIEDNVPCDDVDACTHTDRCLSGVCVGERVLCEDDVACTVDSCDPVDGCVFTPVDSACDDDNPCTEDTCNDVFGCQNAPATEPTPCALNGCDTVGLCVGLECQLHPVPDGFPCADDNPCTINDSCQAGECVGGDEVEVGVTAAKPLDPAPAFDLCDADLWYWRVENLGFACASGNAFVDVPPEVIYDVHHTDTSAWILWRSEGRNPQGTRCTPGDTLRADIERFPVTTASVDAGPGGGAERPDPEPAGEAPPEPEPEPPPLPEGGPPACAAAVFLTEVQATPVVNPATGALLDLVLSSTTRRLSVALGPSHASFAYDDVFDPGDPQSLLGSPPSSVWVADVDQPGPYTPELQTAVRLGFQQFSLDGAVLSREVLNLPLLNALSYGTVGGVGVFALGNGTAAAVLLPTNRDTCAEVCSAARSFEVVTAYSDGSVEPALQVRHFDDCALPLDVDDVSVDAYGGVRLSTMECDGSRVLARVQNPNFGLPASMQMWRPNDELLLDVSFAADPQLAVLTTAPRLQTAAPCALDGVGVGCLDAAARVVNVQDIWASMLGADAGVPDEGLTDDGDVDGGPDDDVLLTGMRRLQPFAFAPLRTLPEDAVGPPEGLLGGLVVAGSRASVRWSDDDGRLHSLLVPRHQEWSPSPAVSPKTSMNSVVVAMAVDDNRHNVFDTALRVIEPGDGGVTGECTGDDLDPVCGPPGGFSLHRRVGAAVRGCGFPRLQDDSEHVCAVDDDCDANRVCDRVSECVPAEVLDGDNVIGSSCLGRCRAPLRCAQFGVDDCDTTGGRCEVVQPFSGDAPFCAAVADCTLGGCAAPATCRGIEACGGPGCLLWGVRWLCIDDTDAGVPDAGWPDAGAPDAGPLDGGRVDGGVVDGGAVDGGVVDGGGWDASVDVDGGLDAGHVDAGRTDAGAQDAGVADGGFDGG